MTRKGQNHCKGKHKNPVSGTAAWLGNYHRGVCKVCGRMVKLDKYGYIGGHRPLGVPKPNKQELAKLLKKREAQ